MIILRQLRKSGLAFAIDILVESQIASDCALGADQASGTFAHCMPIRLCERKWSAIHSFRCSASTGSRRHRVHEESATEKMADSISLSKCASNVSRRCLSIRMNTFGTNDSVKRLECLCREQSCGSLCGSCCDAAPWASFRHGLRQASFSASTLHREGSRLVLSRDVLKGCLENRGKGQRVAIKGLSDKSHCLTETRRPVCCEAMT